MAPVWEVTRRNELSEEDPLQRNAVERLKPFVKFPIDCKASILIPSYAR
jgi:hypothetical protein